MTCPDCNTALTPPKVTVILCPKHEATDELIAALKQTYKLPWPWIPARSISFEEWNRIFETIVQALAKAGAQ